MALSVHPPMCLLSLLLLQLSAWSILQPLAMNIDQIATAALPQNHPKPLDAAV